MASMFQSTRPGRSATSCDCGHLAYHIVSIHAPRAERDDVNGNIWKPLQVFQSTRPGRSATYLRLKMLLHISCFNPRAPGGARQLTFHQSPLTAQFQSTRPGRSATFAADAVLAMKPVSIHAPRAERDLHNAVTAVTDSWFQSTRPGRSATAAHNWFVCFFHSVSIHAPRAERDIGPTEKPFLSDGFNPRAPGGARRR